MKPYKVLLIEDNPADVGLIREMLAEARDSAFELEHAERLAAGLKRLACGQIDVVLLDLSLPDSEGSETLSRVRDEAPKVPIVILTGAQRPDSRCQSGRRGNAGLSHQREGRQQYARPFNTLRHPADARRTR